jgi:hypothetical protein
MTLANKGRVSSLQIELAGIAPIAYLEAAEGTVTGAGPAAILTGNFHLVVNGVASNDCDLTGAKVVTTAAGWRLEELKVTPFGFAQPVVSQAHADGPWLQCTIMMLAQNSAAPDQAWLSFHDVCVSLAGKPATVEPRNICYPQTTGPGWLQIIGQQPDPAALAGFYLVRRGQDFIVQLGKLTDPLIVNHADPVRFIATPDCDFHFVLTPGVGALRFSASQNDTGLEVGATGNAGLAMAENPDRIAGWQSTKIRVAARAVEASAGWLQVKAFVPRNLWLARASNIDDIANATGIYAPTARLGFELFLRTPKARFTYRGPTGTTQPGDRHFGIRVKGLSSTRGVPTTLDADYAVIELLGGSMHVQAGFPLPGRDGTLPSTLLPKIDPRNVGAGRVLGIAVGKAVVNAQAGTSLTLDTNSASFVIGAPVMASPPVGVTAHYAGASIGYKLWQLQPMSGSASQVFTLGVDYLVPVVPPGDATWLTRFATQDPTASYSMIEHPGATVSIDAPPSPARRALAGQDDRTTLTIVNTGGKEMVAYSVFFATLSYVGYRCEEEGGLHKCLDPARFRAKFAALTDQAMQAYVKSNGLSDLRIVYYVPKPGDPAAKGIRAFIDDNNPNIPGALPDPFIWPFVKNLGVLLFQNQKYTDQIALDRTNKSAQPGFIFDFSNSESLDPAELGWTAQDWQNLAKESPSLWPRANNRPGAMLDPSDKLWRGVFFRDMPLYFPVPDAVGQEAPFLAKMIEAINQSLMLDYGWHDESGATWCGGLQANPPIDCTPQQPFDWSSVFTFELDRLTVKGSGSKVATAEGHCTITLPEILTDDGHGGSVPLQIDGAFAVDLTGESKTPDGKSNPVPRIELSKIGNPFQTNSIPGFTMVGLRKIVITDMRRAEAQLDLVAEKQLPFRPIPAIRNPQASSST